MTPIAPTRLITLRAIGHPPHARGGRDQSYLDVRRSHPYDRAMIQIATNANASRRRIIAAGAGVFV